MTKFFLLCSPVVLTIGCSGPSAGVTDTDAATGPATTTGASEPTTTPTTDTGATDDIGDTIDTFDTIDTIDTFDTSPTDDTAGACSPGAQEYCYTGPFASDGDGICVGGTATCLPDGSGFGPCEGEVTPQPEDCDSPEDENCDGLPGCPAGSEQWSKRFGDADRQWAAGVTTDKDGAIVTTGLFEGTLDLGGGPMTSTGSWDIYLARFDAAGAHVWSKQYGGSYGAQTPTAVCLDGTGAVYLAGEFGDDINLGGGIIDGEFGTDSAFIAKYAPDGAYQWARAFTPGENQGFFGLDHIACDPAGGVVIGGGANDDLDLGGGVLPAAGGMDLIVGRFDAQGAHLWSHRYGDDMDQHMGGLAMAPDGDIVLCGEVNGSVDLGGGPRPSSGESDIFLARLDPAGAHLWSLVRGGSSFERCTALAVDHQDAAVIAGDYLGDFNLGGGDLSDAQGDLFLARFDPNGAHLWSRGFGEAFLSSADALAVDADANVYLYGDYDSSFDTFDIGVVLPMSKGSTVFAGKYSSLGAPLWARAYGGMGDAYAGGIAVDSAKDLILTGRFDSDIDFGGGPHLSAGGDDLFLAKVRIE